MTAAMLNGTCAPSNTTGTRDGPNAASTRSMRPTSRASARAPASIRSALTERFERPRTPIRPSWSRTAPATAMLASSIVTASPTLARTTAEPSSPARAASTAPASSSGPRGVTRTAPALRMPTFSARYRPARGAQNLGVLEPDVGDDGDLAIDDIGRVEPAAQAHFDDRPLNSGVTEDEEGSGGQEIEPGRLRRRGPGAPGVLVSVKREAKRPSQRRLADHAALNGHPFGHGFDMGRPVAPDPEARPRQRRLDQRRHRALTLGARHMDGAEGLLRIAEPDGKVSHRLEPDAHELARPAPSRSTRPAAPSLLQGPRFSHRHHGSAIGRLAPVGSR